MSWLERPRKERLTLAGDAAHRTLPYGGWGPNSGIHSAHNLAWQLGAVIRGEVRDALLDTYDSERRDANQLRVRHDQWRRCGDVDVGSAAVDGAAERRA